MKLYPKQLNSVSELQLEKAKLLKESSRFEIKELISFDLLTANGNVEKRSEEQEQNSILSGIIPMILPVAEPIVNFIEDQFPGLEGKVATFVKDRSKKVLISVGKEVLGGYLKWKAIELTFKGARYIIKSKRAKKNKD